MRVTIPFIIVVVLAALGYALGAKAPAVVGIAVPYVAAAAFIGGFIYRLIGWAKVPVPFKIPTTCGQQKTLPWICHDKLEAPATTMQVIGRMALEVLAFRSLFRGTSAKLNDGPRLDYSSSKWLWGAGLAFHWMFLIIFIRHFRLFAQPTPFFVGPVEYLDSFMQITLPAFYMSDLIIVLAVTFLFLRRVFLPQMRYLSLAADYFPLFLILGIVTSGMVMRYVLKTDIAGVKELVQGLLSFRPHIPETVGPLFFMHLTLISALLLYFPFSKLMHMGGVFFSPTRNMTNDSRATRHINPWNPKVKFHTYAEYEEDFWQVMKSVDLPLDKNYEGEKE
jgi:nitrate reductase gamma subunit